MVIAGIAAARAGEWIKGSCGSLVVVGISATLEWRAGHEAAELGSLGMVSVSGWVCEIVQGASMGRE